MSTGGPTLQADPLAATTVVGSFEMLYKTFRPQHAQGVRLNYEYRIVGDDGGIWSVTVADGRCDIHAGENPDAEFVLSITRDDWIALANGRLWSIFTWISIERKDGGLAPYYEQLVLLERMGLVGRERQLPAWAERAGFCEVDRVAGLTSKHGDLDHEDFVNSGIHLDINPTMHEWGWEGLTTFYESLKASGFRRVTWPIAALIACWWALIFAVICSGAVAVLLGWRFGFSFGAFIGVVLFMGSGLATPLRMELRDRIQREAIRNPVFFYYAVQHRIVITDCDCEFHFNGFQGIPYLLLAAGGAAPGLAVGYALNFVR